MRSKTATSSDQMTAFARNYLALPGRTGMAATYHGTRAPGISYDVITNGSEYSKLIIMMFPITIYLIRIIYV